MIFIGRYDVRLFKLILVFLGLYFARMCWIEATRLKPGSPIDETMRVVNHQPSTHHDRWTLKGPTGTVYIRSDAPLNLGDRLHLKGILLATDRPTWPDAFHYPNYLKAIDVLGTVEVESLEVIEGARVFSLKLWMRERWTDTTYFTAFLHALILADRTYFEVDFDQAVKTLGMMHLFAVSGLHVSFLALIIQKGLETLKCPRTGMILIISGVLTGYAILTDFAPSIMRAITWWMVLRANERWRWQLSALDALVLVQLFWWWVFPLSHGHLGFVLSYAMAYTLLIHQKALKTRPLKAAFYVACLAFVFGLPMSTWMQPQVHLLAPLVNTISVIIMSMVVLPLTYLVCVWPSLDAVFGFVPLYFEAGVKSLYQAFPVTLPLTIRPGFETLLYYGCVFFASHQHAKKRYKAWGLPALVVTGCFFRAYLMPLGSLTMFDVQGDAFLLVDAHRQCAILIDTGDIDPSTQLLQALRRRGIHALDVVVLTHNHRDHVGEYETLAAHLPIDLVLAPYHQPLPTDVWHRCGQIRYQVLSQRTTFNHLNEDSLVFLIEYASTTFLFAGDIEQRREAQMIQDHTFKVDWLKVAHHGSNTSSTPAFLDHFQPHTAMLSAHRYNRYGFPHPEVIDRLEARNMTVYRTDESGTLRWFFFSGQMIKKSTPP